MNQITPMPQSTSLITGLLELLTESLAQTMPFLAQSASLLLGIAIALLVVGVLFSIFCIVAIIFQLLAVFKLAKKAGVKHAWLAFIPFTHPYIFGKTAEKLVENETKKPTRYGLWLMLLYCSCILLYGAAIPLFIFALVSNTALTCLVIVALLLITAVVANYILYYQSFFRICNIFNMPKSRKYTIISLLTCNLFSPFLLWALRKKEPQFSKKKDFFEPIFHVSKRDDMPAWKAWGIRIITIIISLLLVGIVSSLLTGRSFVEAYEIMFMGVFGRLFEGYPTMLWKYLQEIAILLSLALALTPAFKMKFWNCGAEGQALVGGLASIVCMIEFGKKLPYPVLILVIAVTSILAGAIWGLIPAIFKSLFNTNETLFTLMMNYIATQVIAYYVYIKGGGSNVINPVKEGNFPSVLGNDYFVNIVLVTIITFAMFIYLRYSKQGYEISVVGESQNTARYIGINVKKVIIRTMIISGALCGVTGMLLVAGTDHSINVNTVGGQGFTAILISWLGQFNPFIMAVMTAIVIFLRIGVAKVADTALLNSSFAEIMVGIVILMLVGCEFFIHYSIKFKHKKEAA